jgi:flagellar hook-length control protein FliK
MPSMSFNLPLGPSHLPPASPGASEAARPARGGSSGFAGVLGQQVQAREADPSDKSGKPEAARAKSASPPARPARSAAEGRPRAPDESARSAPAEAASKPPGSSETSSGTDRAETAQQTEKADADPADAPSSAQAVMDFLARLERETTEPADGAAAVLASESSTQVPGDPAGVVPGLAALASGAVAGQALAGLATAGTGSNPDAAAPPAGGLYGISADGGARGAADRAALASSAGPADAGSGFAAQWAARDAAGSVSDAPLAAGAVGLAGATPDATSALRGTEAAGSTAQTPGLNPLPGLQPLAATEAGRGAPVQGLQLLITTPVTAPDFSASLAAQLTTLARDGIHEATLQLNPAEMGPIAVRIVLDGARAQVDFAAQHAQTREVIESGMPALAAALHGAGLTLSGGGVFEQRPGTPGDGSPGRSGRDPGFAANDEAGDPGAALPQRRTVAGLVDMYA